MAVFVETIVYVGVCYFALLGQESRSVKGTTYTHYLALKLTFPPTSYVITFLSQHSITSPVLMLLGFLVEGLILTGFKWQL